MECVQICLLLMTSWKFNGCHVLIKMCNTTFAGTILRLNLKTTKHIKPSQKSINEFSSKWIPWQIPCHDKLSNETIRNNYEIITLLYLLICFDTCSIYCSTDAEILSTDYMESGNCVKYMLTVIHSVWHILNILSHIMRWHSIKANKKWREKMSIITFSNETYDTVEVKTWIWNTIN